MGLERIARNVIRDSHPELVSGSMPQFSCKTGSINFGSDIEAWMLKLVQHDGGADFTESALA